MTFSALVRARLFKLRHGQRDLARAARVTDSYISQLLTRKKAPPAPDRTDIYARMEAFLELPPGELGRLAELERAEERKRRLDRPSEPLFGPIRELLLRKCVAENRADVRAIFDAQPFGTLEHLVAWKMLEVGQGVARRVLDDEGWIRQAARAGSHSNEEMRVLVLELLDSDVFHVSRESCIDVLDPLVESWSVDQETLRLEITLASTEIANRRRTFAYVEGGTQGAPGEEPGLALFLEDPQLNDHASDEEIRLLRGQSFGGRRPNKLYYYRALQNLRDPLHFHEKPR